MIPSMNVHKKRYSPVVNWFLFICSLAVILPWLSARELSEDDFATVPGACNSWNALVQVHGQVIEWPLGTVSESFFAFSITVICSLFFLGKALYFIVSFHTSSSS